jgi:hypothetical protein
MPIIYRVYSPRRSAVLFHINDGSDTFCCMICEDGLLPDTSPGTVDRTTIEQSFDAQQAAITRAALRAIAEARRNNIRHRPGAENAPLRVQILAQDWFMPDDREQNPGSRAIVRSISKTEDSRPTPLVQTKRLAESP